MEYTLSEPAHVTEVASQSSAPKSSLRSIKVLIVDDSPSDRTLVLRELRREFPDLMPTEASDSKLLHAAYAQNHFDLIVTDYRLYWSDGLDVVRKARELWPASAVVMFTGTGNEEVAVEAMKAGVDDYVLKQSGQSQRFRVAVRKALEYREQERVRESAELRYQLLFDTVPVGLFRCLPTGKLLDVNPALASLLGVEDKTALSGKNFASFHPHPDNFLHWREELEREGSVAFIETKFKTRGGEIRTVEMHARALRDPETRQVVYEGSVEDITARKQAELEREKLIAELRENCAKIKTLTGLLPICASCKKIRDGAGAWNLLETYIEHHSNAQFTHSFCPDCVRRLYPEVFLDRPEI